MPSWFKFSNVSRIHPATSIPKTNSVVDEDNHVLHREWPTVDTTSLPLLDLLLERRANDELNHWLDGLAVNQSFGLNRYLCHAKVESSASEEFSFLKPLGENTSTGLSGILNWNFDATVVEDYQIVPHAKEIFTDCHCFEALPVSHEALGAALQTMFATIGGGESSKGKAFILQVIHAATVCALHVDCNKVALCALDVFVSQIAALLYGFHSDISKELKDVWLEKYDSVNFSLLERMHRISKGLEELSRTGVFDGFDKETKEVLQQACFSVAVKMDLTEHLSVLHRVVVFPADNLLRSSELREAVLYGIACAAANSHCCKPYEQAQVVLKQHFHVEASNAETLPQSLHLLDLVVIPIWVSVSQLFRDLDEPYGHLLLNRSKWTESIRSVSETEMPEELHLRDEAFHATYSEFEIAGAVSSAATGATYLQRFLHRLQDNRATDAGLESPLPSPPPIARKLKQPPTEGKLVQLVNQRTEKALESRRKSARLLSSSTNLSGSFSDMLELFLMRRRTKILFLLLTLFVLFGDDVRLLVLPPSADVYVGIVTTVCFFMFTFELAATCYIRKDYKFSFFFWLDVIALVSLLPDIPIFYDYLLLLLQEESSSANGEGLSVTRASKASRAGARAARIVRILRVVRLLRILKVYELFYRHRKEQKMLKSYGSKYAKQFIRRRSLDRQAQAHMSPDAVALLPESKVGARLADLTTQKVIFIVLLMLFSGPFFSDTTVDFQYASSLGLLHGESIRFKYNESSSFSEMLEGFKNATPSLLLLKMSVISDTDLVYSSVETNEDRYRPIQLIYEAAQCNPCNTTRFLPFTYCSCEPGEQTYAIFDNSAAVSLSSQKNILQTCFIMLLLGAGTFGFSYDINRIVIAPVEGMVNLVNELKANPLADFSKMDRDKKLEKAYETKLLENTIKKIGTLMKVGFGEAGTRLIADNLNRDGELDPMVAGRKVKAIFGYVCINHVDKIVEALGAESLLLFNEIANIVHRQTSTFKGSAIRNSDGRFLIVWVPKQGRLDQTQLADMSLLSFVRMIVDFNVHEGLQALNDPNDPLGRRVKQLVPDFKLSLSFVLHTGEAIEGLIGSEKKLDVSYLSQSVSLASR